MDMKSSHDWSVLAECELKSIRATRRLLYKEQILLSRQLARIEGAKREALRHRNHQVMSAYCSMSDKQPLLLCLLHCLFELSKTKSLQMKFLITTKGGTNTRPGHAR